jgi:hypothetical protein
MPATLPIFAFWPFLHGWMLLWSLAALAPIVIHLLSRRRYRETTWAAMEFLLAALQQHARRLRIEQLLLLALRVAILLLLAMALADPQVSSESAAARPTIGRTHWLIVLDGSMSMGYRDGAATLFEQAREQARQLATEARQGDGLTLLLLADPPRVVIPEPSFDPADVIREIEALRIRHTGADLAQTLELAEEMIRQARRRHPRLTTTRICFFTDLGRTTWNAAEGTAARRVLRQLAEDDVQMSVKELGDRQWTNAAVTRLEMLDPYATVDREVRFLAEVRRFSPDQPQRVRVEMLADGQLLRAEEADLTSGADVVTFHHRFSTPGDHSVQVRLDGDPLEADNRRDRIVMVRDTIRVLCIEGRPGAARYLAFALEPRRLERPVVHWEIAPESILLERDLEGYDMIFLSNVARFSREESAMLKRYVRDGGSAAFFLGDQVDVANYDEIFRQSADDGVFFPFTLGELISGDQRSFDPLEYRHPVVAPFENQPRAGLLTVPTWRYIRLQIPAAAPVRRVLDFDNGDPALVETSMGRGRIFLFASSAAPSTSAGSSSSQAWSELATWPSFPPLIQEMLTMAIQTTDRTRDVHVGQPLEGISRESSGDASVTIALPDGSQERVRLERHEAAEHWTFPGTYWSGLYTATREGADAWQQHFAVSIEPDESQLDRIDPSRLPEQLLPDADDPLGDEPPTAVPQPYSFARWLLGLLLVTLLAESYFAWRFGTSRQ